MLASRIFFNQRRASNVLCRGERIHTLGDTGMEASRGVCWIGGTLLGNGDGFLLSAKGK